MSDYAIDSAKVLSEIKIDVRKDIDMYYRDIMIADSLWEQKNALGQLQMFMKRELKKIKVVEKLKDEEMK